MNLNPIIRTQERGAGLPKKATTDNSLCPSGRQMAAMIGLGLSIESNEGQRLSVCVPFLGTARSGRASMSIPFLEKMKIKAHREESLQQDQSKLV